MTGLALRREGVLGTGRVKFRGLFSPLPHSRRMVVNYRPRRSYYAKVTCNCQLETTMRQSSQLRQLAWGTTLVVAVLAAADAQAQTSKDEIVRSLKPRGGLTRSLVTRKIEVIPAGLAARCQFF